ncbi:MAG: hypothetical protein RLZZ612_2426 [Pseudomonadota bacterium]
MRKNSNDATNGGSINVAGVNICSIHPEHLKQLGFNFGLSFVDP